MQTGRLPKDFSQRLKETGDIMNAITQPHNSREEFLTNNLAQAYKLGLLHTEVAKQVKGALHWNQKERVPMNEQSFGLVLYTFAWWPVEALAATKQIDPVEVNNELNGWFHLWSVIGYEMGVSEDLLPTNFNRAKEIVTLLRKAQYTSDEKHLPDGIPILLGGQVRWLVEGALAHSATGKPTPEQLLPGVVETFAKVIKLSPGLSESLGLGSDPAARLIKYASIPAQK
jgi:ER-bound oxygenase mpaB/B'/Rubber oxygenase, catalytic domain